MLGKRLRKGTHADDVVPQPSGTASIVDTSLSPPAKRAASKGRSKTVSGTTIKPRRSSRVPKSSPIPPVSPKVAVKDDNNSATGEPSTDVVTTGRTSQPTPHPVQEVPPSTSRPGPATPGDVPVEDPREELKENIFLWLHSVNGPGRSSTAANARSGPSSLSSAPASSKDSTPEPLPTLPSGVAIGHPCLAWDKSCFIPAKLVDFIPTATSQRHFVAENRLGQRYNLARNKVLFMYVPEDEVRMMHVTLGECETVLKDAGSRELQEYAQEQIRSVEPHLRRLLAEQYLPAQPRVELFHAINGSPNPVWRSLDCQADAGDLFPNQTLALHQALLGWLNAELAAFSAAVDTSVAGTTSPEGQTPRATALPATIAAKPVCTSVANDAVASAATTGEAPLLEAAPAPVSVDPAHTVNGSTPAGVGTAAAPGAAVSDNDPRPLLGSLLCANPTDPASTSPKPMPSTEPMMPDTLKQPSASTERPSIPKTSNPPTNGTDSAAQATAPSDPVVASATPAPAALPADPVETGRPLPSLRCAGLHPDRLSNFALSVLVPETLIALCIEEFELDTGTEDLTYTAARKKLTKLGNDPVRRFWEDLSERLHYLRRQHDDELERLERSAPRKPDDLLVTQSGRRTRRVSYKV